MKNNTLLRRAWRPSRLAVIIAGFALFLFPSLSTGQEQGFYPGRLRIAKAPYLSAEEREVEGRFAAYLETRTDEATARYIAKYGKEISTDNARELSLDYAPGGMDVIAPATNAARTRWGEAVFQPSRAFSRELYRRALTRETPSHQRRRVFFTAGGAGVGKSTSIQQLSGIAHAIEAAEIIYDTTLSELKSATERIKEGLDAGRAISIVFVYRDPIDALIRGVFPRAKTTGRVVALEGFLTTHLGAVETFLKVAAIYQDNPNVGIAVIDNNRGIDYATLSDMGFIQNVVGKYTRESLRNQLVSATEAAYEKGKKGEPGGLPEMLYQAFNRPIP